MVPARHTGKRRRVRSTKWPRRRSRVGEELRTREARKPLRVARRPDVDVHRSGGAICSRVTDQHHLQLVCEPQPAVEPRIHVGLRDVRCGLGDENGRLIGR